MTTTGNRSGSPPQPSQPPGRCNHRTEEGKSQVTRATPCLANRSHAFDPTVGQQLRESPGIDSFLTQCWNDRLQSTHFSCDTQNLKITRLFLIVFDRFWFNFFANRLFRQKLCHLVGTGHPGVTLHVDRFHAHDCCESWRGWLNRTPVWNSIAQWSISSLGCHLCVPTWGCHLCVPTCRKGCCELRLQKSKVLNPNL